jgi:hypothetical protein
LPPGSASAAAARRTGLGQLLKDILQVPDAGVAVVLLACRLLAGVPARPLLAGVPTFPFLAWVLSCPLLVGVLACQLLAKQLPQGGGQMVPVASPDPDSQLGVRHGVEIDLEELVGRRLSTAHATTQSFGWTPPANASVAVVENQLGRLGRVKRCVADGATVG